MNGQYTTGDRVMNNWKLTRLIGEGNFGKVFEAERPVFAGSIEKVAIKIITAPKNKSDIKDFQTGDMSHEELRASLLDSVNETGREIALMANLKGASNIVGYEDYHVEEHTNGIGWDIFLRMELLTPLMTYFENRPFTPEDAVKLGIDICRALELCNEYNIIHRDIKPGNIMISKFGEYKLGDFGIARTLEKADGGLTKIGTPAYAAPEVFRAELYGPGVDIYSLGITLYWLLNDRRAPFMPPYPAPITNFYKERDAAIVKRLNGQALPPPRNAGERLSGIILKACAYKATDRHATPLQMRRQLEALAAGDEPKIPVFAAPQPGIPPAAPNEIRQPFAAPAIVSASEPHMALAFLLDISRSMALPKENPRIQHLNQGLNRFKQEVCQSKQVREILDVAIIAFNNEHSVIQKFTPVEYMEPVNLAATGRTKMAPAIDAALDMVENRTRFYRLSGAEPYKPWVILISDGAPDDDISFAAQRIKQLEKMEKVSFRSLGVEGYNSRILHMLSGPKVMKLIGTDFTSFFDWVNKSMRSVSQSTPGMKPAAIKLTGNVVVDTDWD